VHQILRKCVLCKRFECQPYRPPKPPPLPLFRVNEAPSFTYSGVDFAGPLFTRGAIDVKVWICLFICCVMRAVHINIIQDLTTPSFIRCLKGFVARRGLPAKMVSDNGKTFQAAAKVLQAVVCHNDVQKYLSGLGIQWTFNLPKSPWWGGLFERLIRSAKRLCKIVGRARLTLDELLTAVVEVEAVLNACPLTYQWMTWMSLSPPSTFSLAVGFGTYLITGAQSQFSRGFIIDQHKMPNMAEQCSQQGVPKSSYKQHR